MTSKYGTGQLKNRVAFDKQGSASDGAGGTATPFVEQFVVSAGYIHRSGGEAVTAARLQGRHVLVIFVRASSQSRQVTRDWRARDARTGVAYNIRDITATEDRAWIEFLCESGVAT